MYPDVSQMYLKCPVTFQENTCIDMYFTRIPNESKIHVGIHMRYIKIHVSCTWDTCGIHAGYIYEIHVSAEVRGYMEDLHAGYIRDT